MALGYRVLGLAAGRVLAESTQDLTKINLQNLSQHTYGMRMLGFAVISNPLRSDSTAAITELQDRYLCMHACVCLHVCLLNAGCVKLFGMYEVWLYVCMLV